MNGYSIKRYIGFPFRSYPEAMDEDMSVFQRADFQKSFFKNSIVYGFQKKKLPVTYVVRRDKRIVMIFPSFENSSSVELAGNTTGICSLSPIFFENNVESQKEIFEFFLSNIKNRTVILPRIREDSKMYTIISGMTGKYKIEDKQTKCVQINFANGQEAHVAGLSKSVRQNIRTAYNRLKTDEKSFRFEMIHGNEISTKRMDSILEIYNNRHEERYKEGVSKLKRFYLKNLDYATRNLYFDYAVHAFLYIDGNIAGFFSGYYDKNKKSIVIPRLSIDAEYGRYSPGYVLLNETMKYYSENNDVQIIDLATGDEKYKCDMGGEIYNRFEYAITL